MIAELKQARAALQHVGWVGAQHEPWCLDRAGRRVLHHDEGLHLYSVAGALQQHGARETGLALIHRIVSPRLAELAGFVAAYKPGVLTECYDPGRCEPADARRAPSIWLDLEQEERWWNLQEAAAGEFVSAIEWLRASGRSFPDVLAVFTEAIVRSKKAATGERR